MPLRKKLAFGCFLLALLLSAAFGVLYLVSPQFMPYHAAAIGTRWNDLDLSHRVLFLAFMKSAGAGFLGTAIAGGFVLFVSFRAGAPWARWALLLSGLIVGIPTLYATLIVKVRTPASPPWIAPVLGILLVSAGFLLSPRDARAEINRTDS